MVCCIRLILKLFISSADKSWLASFLSGVMLVQLTSNAKPSWAPSQVGHNWASLTRAFRYNVELHGLVCI